jgi:hypothetical protein
MKRLGHWIVIALLCFHMTGVLAMSVPEEAKEPPAVFLRDRVRPYTDPYLYWTSQWQYWNLFAPNPTNWITEHRLDAYLDGEWRIIGFMNPDTVPFWRRSDELKIQERIEDENMERARLRYLMDMCIRMGVKPGTSVRLVYRTRVLDRDSGSPTNEEWNEEGTSIAYCPPAL